MQAGKVLIVGINGFVGAHLTKEFGDAGYDVLGCDLQNECTVKGVGQYSNCNICDKQSVLNVIEKVNPKKIVNLAAISSVAQSWRNPSLTLRVNVEGTLNIIEAVREMSEPASVLFVGSSEMYAPSDRPLKETDPLVANNPYGISKIAQENFINLYAKNYGLDFYVTRSFNHTGPGQSTNFVLPSWVKQVSDITKSGESGKVCAGNLGVVRSFTDVRDIAHAYRLILEKGVPGEVYNVGSEETFKLKELLNFIIAFSDQAIGVEIDEILIRPTDIATIACDSSKIQNELGWEPEHKLGETLAEMYDYFMYEDEQD